MAQSRIDPDGVIALASAALKAAEEIEQDAKVLQRAIDGARGLVPGAPDLMTRSQRAAGNLVEQSGIARLRAVEYIDKEQPWRNVWTTAQFWLPSWSNVAWNSKETPYANLVRILTSDEVGAGGFGLSTELLNRYGRGLGLLLPQGGASVPAPVRMDALAKPAVTAGGTGYVWRNGLLVPQGVPGVDPAVPKMPPMPSAENLRTVTVGRGLSAEPVNPPPWARTAGKALGVAGAALTVFGAGYSQWQTDDKYHPNMSTGEHLQRAATTAVVEGGAAAAGGWGGAVVGGEIGASVGTMICPGVGTVVGGIAGGVIGAFAGSKAGAAVGRGARKAWNALFG